MKRRNFLKGLLLTIPAVAGCRAIKDPTREVVTILPSPMSEKPEYLAALDRWEPLPFHKPKAHEVI